MTAYSDSKYFFSFFNVLKNPPWSPETPFQSLYDQDYQHGLPMFLLYLIYDQSNSCFEWLSFILYDHLLGQVIIWVYFRN